MPLLQASAAFAQKINGRYVLDHDDAVARIKVAWTA
jgi:hypothetical protein